MVHCQPSNVTPTGELKPLYGSPPASSCERTNRADVGENFELPSFARSEPTGPGAAGGSVRSHRPRGASPRPPLPQTPAAIHAIARHEDHRFALLRESQGLRSQKEPNGRTISQKNVRNRLTTIAPST
jgi:hypothetical protein